MTTAEQTMILKCQNCGWTSESPVTNATEEVAGHLKDWTEEQGYPFINHIVHGTIITVFTEEQV